MGTPTLPIFPIITNPGLGTIITSFANPVSSLLGNIGPWRPPQWSQGPLFSMTATSPVTGDTTAYVFDAVLVADHDQEAVVTMNPVQTGAAITDHVYIQPARLVIEIKMSDSMQSYNTGAGTGQWAANPSKSVSAY